MGDLVLALRAQRQQQRVSQQLLAWHVAHVINLVAPRHKRVSVADLLPYLRKPVVFTLQQFGGDVEKLKAAVAAKQAEMHASEGEL